MPKRIAVVTPGGDAPGMNAAVRAVVRTALREGCEVLGVHRGYAGLMEGDFELLESKSVSGIVNRGGTVLHTVRCEAFKRKAAQKAAFEHLKDAKVEGLVVIGGNGSYGGALSLHQLSKLPIVGIPATIDNDVPGTDVSIGFDTAVNTALDAIDKIRDTAFSHERVFVIEVMGRKRGFLALEVGIAGGASFVLIPEIRYSLDRMARKILKDHARGKSSTIIVVAEGAGRAEQVGRELQNRTGLETRVTVLGHIQRGGNPTAQSRVYGSLLGSEAVKTLLETKECLQVGIRSGVPVVSTIAEVMQKPKKIDQKLYQLIHSITY